MRRLLAVVSSALCWRSQSLAAVSPLDDEPGASGVIGDLPSAGSEPSISAWAPSKKGWTSACDAVRRWSGS